MAGLLSLAVLPAAAAESPYVGIQGQKLTWEQGGFPETFRADVESVGLIGGMKVNQVLGLEARYSTGVDSDDTAVGEIDLDYQYGVYGRVTLPTEGMFKPYGIVGYSNLRLEFDGETDDGEDDGSYGLGFSVALDSPLQLDAEWIQYINKDGFDVDSVNVGLTYRF